MTTETALTIGGKALPAALNAPEDARGTVIFAHGSGSSRSSPRNIAVAARLNDARMATLLFDLLTPDEAADRRNVFDVELLGERMVEAIAEVRRLPGVAQTPIGLFGASTGAAAALIAAAARPHEVSAVVSRGGRPDLAMPVLPQVVAPTLLIVGGYDDAVIEMNERAAASLRCEKRLAIVPGATHLFEEPGTLEKVMELAVDWFTRHLHGALS
jgi:pimeloyl-ACP methyl ester carboxylesterase